MFLSRVHRHVEEGVVKTTALALGLNRSVSVAVALLAMGWTSLMAQTPSTPESRHRVMTIYAASRSPRPHHMPNYGGITFLGRDRSNDGGVVRANTLMAPEEARQAFDQAMQAMSRRGGPNLKKAAKKLDKALEIYPEFAAAWNLRGTVHAAKAQSEKARTAFRTSIRHDPEAVSGHWSLALLEIREKNWREAAFSTTRLLEIEPTDPAVRFYHGLVCYYRGYWSAAQLHLAQVVDGPHSEAFPLGRFFLANSLAEQGQFQQASHQFQQFLARADHRVLSRDLRRRIQSRLSEWTEQGLLSSR
ncbi:MAG TPA: tetratricopeptide repeat protein [Acidobacteriota bacterium]|nr:tetratricopeptide repeat protein [Acidobacteriota bacterium]